MKVGRKPKPTALKILQGNPGRRPLPQGEIHPERGAPQCPDWLDPIARQEWERIVPTLDKLGILTKVDGAALEGYCQAYAHWRQHEEALRRYNDSENGHTYTAVDRSGNENPKALPQAALVLKYQAIMHAFMGELGLSPSMRTRISGPPPGEEKESNDRLKNFFAKKREET